MHDSKNTNAVNATGAPHNESQALPNPKHEAFAQAIALGEDPITAYQHIHRCKPATAQAKSAALLEEPPIAARIATLQQEASHIAEHQAHFDKAQLIAFLVETIQTPVSTVDQHHRQCQEWTRDELTTSGRRAQSTPGQKTQTSSAKTSARSKSTCRSKGSATNAEIASGAGESTADTATNPAPESTAPILLRSKTKLPSKLDAAKLLATLCGWHAPTRHEGNLSHSISPTVQEALLRLLR
jgi:hypothetical protein